MKNVLFESIGGLFYKIPVFIALFNGLKLKDDPAVLSLVITNLKMISFEIKGASGTITELMFITASSAVDLIIDAYIWILLFVYSHPASIVYAAMIIMLIRPLYIWSMFFYVCYERYSEFKEAGR